MMPVPWYIGLPLLICFFFIIILALINNILHPQYYGSQGSLFSLNLSR
jgi:hypothetical protein